MPARGHNLKSIDVAFPLGVLCVVTGVSGAGKSTLVEETLYPALRRAASARRCPLPTFTTSSTATGEVDDVVFLDQTPIGRSGRSNPVDLPEGVRRDPQDLRRDPRGQAAELRRGPVQLQRRGGPVQHLRGRRLPDDRHAVPARRDDALSRVPRHALSPRDPRDHLPGPEHRRGARPDAREAFVFFRHRPKVQARLRPLLDIGLDYLRLGQPASTLSGGEAQRLKLASFLGSSTAALNRAGNISQTVFILDEPTAGLHPFDMLQLLDALSALVDRGHSVIVIEHSPEVMVCADWIIDLGPGAGDEGGKIVAAGTPEDVARSGTLTGGVIAAALEKEAPLIRPEVGSGRAIADGQEIAQQRQPTSRLDDSRS